jgi:hypothetical protein
MTAREEPDGSLVLSYDTRLWAQIAAAATVLFLATAGYDYVFGRHGEDRLIGLFGSAATMAVFAYVMSERSRFRVDPARRRIDWEQGFAWRVRRGSIGFDDVRHVSLERPLGDNGVPSRRVILHLANGTQLPVTIGYRPDGDRAITMGAELLRDRLGHSGPGVSDTARLLIAAGKKLDAVKLLADQEGLSLTDAKKRADDLQRG